MATISSSTGLILPLPARCPKKSNYVSPNKHLLGLAVNLELLRLSNIAPTFSIWELHPFLVNSSISKSCYQTALPILPSKLPMVLLYVYHTTIQMVQNLCFHCGLLYMQREFMASTGPIYMVLTENKLSTFSSIPHWILPLNHSPWDDKVCLKVFKSLKIYITLSLNLIWNSYPGQTKFLEALPFSRKCSRGH